MRRSRHVISTNVRAVNHVQPSAGQLLHFELVCQGLWPTPIDGAVGAPPTECGLQLGSPVSVVEATRNQRMLSGNIAPVHIPITFYCSLWSRSNVRLL